MNEKLWSGRFSEDQHTLFDTLNKSIKDDIFLAPWDIKGSKAHAYGLYLAKIFSIDDYQKIVDALDSIALEIAEKTLQPCLQDEDVHMWIERLLTEKVGVLGKKLHTARSRNDQVATATKLWLKDTYKKHLKDLKTLIKVLCTLAKQHVDTLIPGYTHLQLAQPISLGFYLMAYANAFKRDYLKADALICFLDESPLGSGAFAGVNYPIERLTVAQKMGFSNTVVNAMDAVSDRDYVNDYLYWCTLISQHLSRLSEDFIIWNTPQFNFITLADAFSSGSSIMPQKKNPDGFEIIRAKAAVANGRLNTMLSVLKGLAMSYNKDLQEDKKLLYNAHNDLAKILKLMPKILKTTTFNIDTMKKAVSTGFCNATDLADALVLKDIPFRQAHHIVGQLVAIAAKQNKQLENLSLETFKSVCDIIDCWVYKTLDYNTCLKNKKSAGSTSQTSVMQQIKQVEDWL